MVNRRDLKSAHEDAVLRDFEAHLADQGVKLEVLARPEPPDATATIDGKNTWIEITDAFLDEQHAIGLTTGASDDVVHIPDDARLIIDPDETFSKVVHAVIASKLDKQSMHKIAANQGAGILLLGIFTPFTTAREVARLEAVAVAELMAGTPQRVFETIYVYDGYGQRQFHVLHPQN